MKSNFICSVLSKVSGRQLKERISIPKVSILLPLAEKAYFYDCFSCKIEDLNEKYQGQSPFGKIMEVMGSTPAWVDVLMQLRNRVVSSLFGLKDLGALGKIDSNRPLSSYKIGDRIGIFTLMHVSEDQVVLGDDDNHLDVQVSLCHYQEPEDGNKPSIAITTLVRTHNLLGKVYMFFVAPVHGIIAPVMFSNLLKKKPTTTV